MKTLKITIADFKIYSKLDLNNLEGLLTIFVFIKTDFILRLL